MADVAMTSRERWLAAIHVQPVDRLPFWPKLSPAYLGYRAGAFAGMSLDDLHEWIGSDRHEWAPLGLRETHRTCGVARTTCGAVQRTTYSTPYGTLTQEYRLDPVGAGWHPMEHPLKTRDDLHAMAAFYCDMHIEPDADGLASARAQRDALGAAGVTATSIGESPLMHFVEHLAGVENAQYLLADYPDDCGALFDAMHADLRRRVALAAVVAEADLLYLTENTSTTLISPAQYRALCLPHIREYCTIVREAGRPMVLHMCGHLKAILPDLATTGAQAFEAFTSPTVGNTTLADGRAACPDVCLIGGTNAALWLRPAAEIIDTLEQDLGALPHLQGIVVTSAGVMPPACAPETIRTVRDWLVSRSTSCTYVA